MSAPEMPRVARAPEWVGEGDDRRDVASLTDRHLAIMGVDLCLRLVGTLRTHTTAFLAFQNDFDAVRLVLLKELPGHERRITSLEASRLRAAGHNIPPLPEEEPAREASHHEWDRILTRASADLTRRVKDPRDRLDSDRAREIATEVVKRVQTDADAAAFRGIKSKGWKIVFAIVKYAALVLVAALAGHYGLKK
jgi:hypothetical protein